MSLICFGSPMLDIIANVSDDFLDKHNLESSSFDSQVIFEELQNLETQEIVGGSITNTVRVFSWISPKCNDVTFVGAIGNDQPGKKIETHLVDEGINCVFTRTEKATDKCAVLINKDTRMLVTYLNASFDFNCSTYYKHEVQEALQKSTHVYFSGLFLRISTRIIVDLLGFYGRKEIIFNLGAAFVVQKFHKEIFGVIKKASIVFGNEEEWDCLYEQVFSEKCDCNKSKLMRVVCRLRDISDGIFVMTRGNDSVLIFSNGGVEEYPALFCENLVDTNGAGDAFVGGFLAAYLSNQDVKSCIHCGLWAASEIVQNVGCNFERSKQYLFK